MGDNTEHGDLNMKLKKRAICAPIVLAAAFVAVGGLNHSTPAQCGYEVTAIIHCNMRLKFSSSIHVTVVAIIINATDRIYADSKVTDE